MSEVQFESLMRRSNPLALVISQSEKLGGAERFITRLYEQLSMRSVEYKLAGFVPGWQVRPETDVEVHLSPKWSRKNLLPGLLKSFRERRRLATVAREIMPDWVHMQFKREQIMFTEPLSSLAPVFWTEHGVFPPTMRPLIPAYARAARHCAGIICVSSTVASSVRDIVDPAVPVHVIENAVDLSRHRVPSGVARAEARAQVRAGAQRVVVWAGRLDPRKRPELAIRYAAKYSDDLVIIAGDGPLRAVVDSRAEQLSNLRSLGHVERVERLLDAADVLMFTSTGHGEGLPTIIAEATAQGVPVVTHAGSGAEDLVRAVDGVVVGDAGDMSEWRRGMDVAMHSGGSELRSSWAARHGVDVWADEHLRLFTGGRAT